MFDSEGLSDFGTGLFSGATVGSKVSGGNPYATVGSGLAGGFLSYFGGAKQRRLEAKNNANELELQGLTVSDAKRKRALEEQQRMKMQQFGQMLGQWFQKQGGG